ncbi:acetate--CoA ligase family protein [Candidatus Pacearchaeota archaeon]|nr:acetate--CoA ligase family protein [Candidatus Pacearchaeota archaeon]
MKTEVLDLHKSQQFIEKFINIPKSQIINSIKELTIKAPLVLKIISPDAIHKTEIGGVIIVHRKEEIESSFNELISIAKNNKIHLKGILAQEFIEGQQLIIGLKKDSTFNHVILFGLGGIFTELLDDVSIRKCPITINEAQEMILELKSKKLFEGFRNIKLNINALKESLVAVSKIPQKHKSIKELDINPFILNSKEGKAVDARVVLEK